MSNSFRTKLKIFLCHAVEDKPTVRKLYYRLKSSSYDIWFDERSLLAGQEWKVEISKAIRNADVIIFCLSAVSVAKAGYVQAEIKEALEIAKEKPEDMIYVVPLKLDECTVPVSIQKWHFVNFFEEDGYKKLIRSLNMHKKKLTPKHIEENTTRTSQSPKFENEKPTVRKRVSQRSSNQFDSIWPAIRLVYRFVIKDISQQTCGVIIDTLKGRVAVSPKYTQDSSITNTIYNFITTSRPVEKCLQSIEVKAQKMAIRKIPPEFWMIIGGYGSGKSHMKEYISNAIHQRPNRPLAKVRMS